MGQTDKVFMRNFMLVLGALVALAIVVFVVAQQIAGPKMVALKDAEKNIARTGVSAVAGDKVKTAAKVVNKKVTGKKIVAKKTAAQF